MRQGIQAEDFERVQSIEELVKMRTKARDDTNFIERAARLILQREALLLQAQKRPELLIECLFYVVDKQKQTVPFFLNTVQKRFMLALNGQIEAFENGERSDISVLVLKGRQQGFTTLITAYQLAMAITRRNFEGLTMADNVDNAQVIFDNKAKFIYDRLPSVFKHSTKYNNRRELRFEKINSYLSVDVATKNTGRSRTINFFHGSECAFWKEGVAAVQSGLFEALTPNCIKIYESTANGYGDYRDMWQSDTHCNLFFAWWETPEYTLPATKNEPPRYDAFLTERLRLLKSKHLSDGQCRWYAQKYWRYLNRDLIRQEYPCSAEEAFLSSGRPVFDVQAVQSRLMELEGQTPRKQGFRVVYQNADARDSITAWHKTQNGSIQIYEEPKKEVPYVIGGDTAGEGSDAYTAYVLRNDTGRQVASLHMPLKSADCTPFVEQLYALGMHYNEALIAPEINFNLQVVAELHRLQYKNLYVREQVDTYTKKNTKQFGFKTDGNTRPMILSLFSAVVAEHVNWIFDRDLLLECLSFEYNEKGRPDARSGTHDDRIFAAAIAYKAREQQTYTPTIPTKTVYVPKDIFDDYQKANGEEKKRIENRYGGILAKKSGER